MYLYYLHCAIGTQTKLFRTAVRSVPMMNSSDDIFYHMHCTILAGGEELLREVIYKIAADKSKMWMSLELVPGCSIMG